MNKREDILQEYKNSDLISERAYKRLNDDIKRRLEKSIEGSKKKIRRLKKLVEEGRRLKNSA